MWLRSVIYHIQITCGFSLSTGMPTSIFEDTMACIAQIREGYIKEDRTKYNLANLFTKALPTSTFEKLVYGISMRQLCKLHD